MGKRASRHTRSQEEIDRILLEEALAGHTVVRLKGGDPFLFGRGGEELELLAAHGVPFQVVPGITSAIAVPAYCGHPGDPPGLQPLRPHHHRPPAPGPELDLDYEALVRMGGTLVFLMGVGALPALCRGLMEAGMAPDIARRRPPPGHHRRDRGGWWPPWRLCRRPPGIWRPRR